MGKGALGIGQRGMASIISRGCMNSTNIADCGCGTRSLSEALQWGRAYFERAGVESPLVNAEALLEEILMVSRAELYVDNQRRLVPEEMRLFQTMLYLRARHVPLQYITGKAGFFSLEFEVDPSVLIPRPETEILVETVFAEAMTMDVQRTLCLVDIGTGSGNIAVSLAKNLKNCRVYATDISAEAVRVARRNAERHRVTDRVQFFHGDLFEPFMRAGLKAVDFVVSNPPYIAEDEYRACAPEVRDYEPRCALWGGDDGCDYYIPLITGAADILSSGGIIVLEVSPRVVRDVRAFLEGCKQYEDVRVVKDYCGRERVIIARRFTPSGV